MFSRVVTDYEIVPPPSPFLLLLDRRGNQSFCPGVAVLGGRRAKEVTRQQSKQPAPHITSLSVVVTSAWSPGSGVLHVACTSILLHALA